MSTRLAPSALWLGLVFWLGIAACGDESGSGSAIGTDALVVVQETNLGVCSEPNWYERSVIRDCDGEKRTILICSEEPLCEDQLRDLLDPQQSCDEQRTLYTTETNVDCEGLPEAPSL